MGCEFQKLLIILQKIKVYYFFGTHFTFWAYLNWLCGHCFYHLYICVSIVQFSFYSTF